MNIILVSVHLQDSPQAMSLAAGLLKAYVDFHTSGKFTITLVEADLSDSIESVSLQIQEHAPDLIGFSIYVWNQEYIYRIIQDLQKHCVAKFFAGGPQAGATPAAILSSGYFEFLIRGEGEESFLMALERISENKNLTGIPGLVNGDASAPERISPAFISNLDELVSPFLSGTIDTGSSDGVLWEISRGCIFHCSFCYEGRGISGVRTRSVESIIPELRHFSETGVSQIFVLDPTFNQKPDRAKQILKLILQYAPQIHYSFEIRTEFLDEEMAELFSELHCSLQIGLESASPDVVRNVGRNFNREKYAAKIQMLNEAGVVFGLDLIYGLPGDSLQTFSESLDYAIELQPNHLDIFPLAVLPGTELFDKKDELQLVCMDSPPYLLVKSADYSSEDLESASHISEAVNLFYNKGGAVGWLFMVLETLDLRPFGFFERFHHWLERLRAEGDNQTDITELQIGFVRILFEEAGIGYLLTPLLDVIRLHGAFRDSLRTGDSLPDKEAKGISDPFVVKPASTIIVSLQYHPDELLRLSEYNLSEFMEFHKTIKTSVIVYNSGGEVRHLAVDEGYADIIEKIVSQARVSDLVDSEDSEMVEWIHFCLEEGILRYSS